MERQLPDRHSAQSRRLRIIAAVAALIGTAAVVFLAISVVRQVSALNEDTFETAQWSLSQTEIEFLEFSKVLTQAEPDLDLLRLRFDIFYSRITTLSNAAVFEPLRQDGDFAVELGAVQMFLDMAVPIIDAPDEGLLDSRAALITAADEARQNVRSLAINGLENYIAYLDLQRRDVRFTSTQLGSAIAALFAGLALVMVNMDRLNKRVAERGRDLLKSNTHLNTIVGSALDGIIVTDASFEVVEFNPAAEAIFQCSAAEALGRDLMEFVDVNAEGSQTLDRVSTVNRLLGTRGRLKGTGYRPDESSFPIEIAVERAKTPGGEIQVAFVRDISRRAAAERELVSARDAALAGEKVKSDFLATMSHEIRTPLNGLMGNIDLLRDTDLTDMQQRYVHNMVTSGRMLMQHVSDVLDITQYDAGKLTLKNVITHLPTLIEDVIATQVGLAEAKKICLTWRWDGTPTPWVMTDPDRIQLILMNLVSNAVKFTRSGQVAVTARHEVHDAKDCLALIVTDTGPGIGPDQIDKIFDDFVTGDASEARAVGGSGLGLGIARRFSEALGGRVFVESTLGEGSTFEVFLPIELATAPDQGTATTSPKRASRQHVLLVEDNEINRAVAREMLVADGHRVTEAVDGATGLALAQTTRFDLILMDISMPGMDGRETSELIVGGDGASKDTPIIALTANALPSKVHSFLRSGLSATITKPVSRNALRHMLLAVSTSRDYAGVLVSPTHLAETKTTLGPEAFAQIRGRFASEVDAFLALLSAIPRTPLADIAEAAHKTASSAILFGAVRLQSALLDLERVALAGDGVAVHHLRCDLPDLWAETQSALQVTDTAGIPAS